MLYSHFYDTLVKFALFPICEIMCFYNGIHFTMYAVIDQCLGTDTFCMSEAVMRLVAGTFYYENVVRAYTYNANCFPFQC